MICFTSSPEQNAGSAPVITRHRAVGRAHGLLELGVEGVGQRVAGLGPVQRDDADVAVLLVGHLGVGHGRRPYERTARPGVGALLLSARVQGARPPAGLSIDGITASLADRVGPVGRIEAAGYAAKALMSWRVAALSRFHTLTVAIDTQRGERLLVVVRGRPRPRRRRAPGRGRSASRVTASVSARAARSASVKYGASRQAGDGEDPLVGLAGLSAAPWRACRRTRCSR